MRIEQLSHFIVPLAFAAIWALTSLFNREAQPLPPRAGGVRPPGPRPGSPQARTAVSSPRNEPDPSRPADRSQSPTDPGRRDNERYGARPQPEVRRAPANPPKPAPGAKRVVKGRPTPAPQTPQPRDRNESTPRHKLEIPLTTSTSGPAAAPRGGHLDPLSLPPSPLLSGDTPIAMRAEDRNARADERDHVTADALLRLLLNPARLRETLLVNELLQPPVSMRGRRSPRA